MSGESSQSSGRERAIEALIDLDPRGPSFRVGKIINEAPISASSNRPNLITRATVTELAMSLSKFEKNESHYDPKLFTNNHEPAKKNRESASEATTSEENEEEGNGPTSGIEESWKITEEGLERAIRHHNTVVKAKSSAANTSSPESAENKTSQSEDSTVRAAPPPELVRALRKIYGYIPSSDNFSTEDVENEEEIPSESEMTTSKILPSLLSSLLKSPVFGPLKKEKTENEGPSDNTSVEESKPEESDKDADDDDDDDEESIEKILLKSTNITSSSANIESIVGNACLNSLESEETESLEGLLIAALSIMTSPGADADNDDSDEPSLDEGDFMMDQTNFTPIGHCDNSSFQVGGPLSILTEKMMKVDPQLMERSKFVLDPNLSRYLLQAASVYEERIELEKAHLLEKIKISADSSGGKDESKEKPFTTKDSKSPVAPPPLTDASSDGSENEEDTTEGGNGSSSSLRDSPTYAPISDPDDSPTHERGAADNDEHESSSSDDEQIDDDNEDEDDSDSTCSFRRARQHFMDSNIFVDEMEGNDSNSSSSDEEEEEEADEESIDNPEVNEANALAQALALSLAEGEANVSPVISNTQRPDENTIAGLSQDSKNEERDVSDSIARDNSKGDESDINNNKDKTSEAHEPGGDSESVDTSCDKLKLPPLPALPPNITTLLGGQMEHLEVDMDTGKYEVKSEIPPSYFDPSSLSTFGMLPSRNILMQLLVNAMVELKHRVLSSYTNDKDFIQYGVGADLFHRPLKRGSTSSTTSKNLFEDTSPRNGERECSSIDSDTTILYLLIATLYLSSSAYTDTVQKLNQFLSKDKRKFASSNPTDTSDELSASELSPELSIEKAQESFDERDDPASAMASHNFSSVMESNRSSSEALEEKGLRRKAAAAAQLEALKKEKEERRINKLHERLQFYLQLSLLVLRSLRLFVKCLATTGSQQSNNEQQDKTCRKFGFDSVHISPLAQSRLTTALKTFSCPRLSQVLREVQLFSDTRDDLILSILSESTAVWGESVMLLFSSQASVEDELYKLTSQCFPSTSVDNEGENNLVSPLPRLEDVGKSFPWTDFDEKFLKLDSLCGKLQEGNMLQSFVPSPQSYVMSLNLDQFLKTPKCRPFSLLSKIGDIIFHHLPKSLDISKWNLTSFYYGLCHRCNSNLILWNNLGLQTSDYSINSDDDIANDSLPASNGAPGDSNLQLNRDPTFGFDNSKCAESIAITPNPDLPYVTQRASKNWGTVLSTKHFNRRTGVHRWAVKLDKCERGHIFVGVASSRVSTKTYVGGDKFGWGLIGTQALWHDRRKIRGDYGSTFRTGSIIIVTLDTDAGTLRFGVWKESGSKPQEESPSSETLTLTSPVSNTSKEMYGSVDDWGIAFEGLPLDAKLYPAVGLYQRDDRVSFLRVDSRAKSGIDRLGAQNGEMKTGQCYYPTLDLINKKDTFEVVNVKESMETVQKWNHIICEEGILYSSNLLNHAIDVLSQPHPLSNVEKGLFTSLIPSLASSLSLTPPSIPILSGSTAMTLIPLVLKCLSLLEERIEEQNIFLTPSKGMKNGSWTIRATPSTSSSSTSRFPGPFEEYIVDLQNEDDEGESGDRFSGNGVGTTGKSANGKVSIEGTAKGTALHFVEEWTSEKESSKKDETASSSCVIQARLNLDGTRFEGTYRNVQFSTTGVIAGNYNSDSSSKEMKNMKEENQDSFRRCCDLLSFAASHLSTILSSGAPVDDVSRCTVANNEICSERKEELFHFLLSSPILSTGLKQRNLDSAESHFAAIKKLFPMPLEQLDEKSTDVISSWHEQVHTSLFSLCQREIENKQTKSASIDSESELAPYDDAIAQQVGGFGSLSALDRENYNSTRRSIILALLHHTGLSNEVISMEEDRTAEGVPKVWQTALQIMESGMRASLLSLETGKSRKSACQSFCNKTNAISNFLHNISVCEDVIDSIDETLSHIQDTYNLISGVEDITYLEDLMNSKSRHGILRFIGLFSLNPSPTDRMKTTVSRECMISHFGRLIGRGIFKMGPPDDDQTMPDSTALADLGSSTLTGCSYEIQQSIMSLLEETFQGIKKTMSEISSKIAQLDEGQAMSPSLQSLTLAVMSTFLFAFHHGNYANMIAKTDLWDFIRPLISYCQSALRGNLWSNNDPDISSTQSSSLLISDATSQHIDLGILKCTMSTFHAVTFQLGAHIRSSQTQTDVDVPLAILLSEISSTCEEIVENSKLQNHNKAMDLVKQNYSNWLDSSKETKKSKIRKKNQVTRDDNAGLRYLLSHGPEGSHLRSSSGQTPNGSSEHLSSLTNCEHYFIHLLNILCSVLHSDGFPTFFQNKAPWINDLIGKLCFEKSNMTMDRSFLPIRFRIRIFRLLRLILLGTEPDSKITRQLFCHAGILVSSISRSPSTANNIGICENYEHDVYLESRAVVSLLRHLYTPSTESHEHEHLCWRRTIHDILHDSVNETNQDLHCGIMSFLGGVPGRISVGSYVLLKPSSATFLSSSSQLSSGKSSSSSTFGSSGTGVPPVVAGSGMEGIVAGLCRDDAMAGMISHIDMVDNACEIVLFDRHKNDNLNSESTGTSMTVRAVRGPLSDVVSADENALILDSSFSVKKVLGAFLQNSVKTISSLPISASKNDTNSHSSDIEASLKTEIEVNPTDLFATLLCLRSNAVTLANPLLLQKYLEQESSSITTECFSKLLLLASTSSIHDEFVYTKSAIREGLSSLPEYEARLWHLQGMLANVQRRKTSLKSTATDDWFQSEPEKKEEEKAQSETNRLKVETSSDHTRLERYSTPPATAVVPDAFGASSQSETQQDNDGQVSDQVTNSTGGGRDEEEEEEEDDENEEEEDENEENEVGEEEDDDEDEASRLLEETEVAHLQEAAVVQMAELGLPRSWSEYALRRVGGANIEAAVHFCLERAGGDMERLLAEEQEQNRRVSSSSSGPRRRNVSGDSAAGINHLLRQLVEMGFPRDWCTEALAATGNNVDQALTWILTNGDRLNARYEANGDEDDDDDDDDDDDSESGNDNEDQALVDDLESSTTSVDKLNEESKETEEEEKKPERGTGGWMKGVVCPLRSISGQTNIDPQTLEITGLPSGGFSSVGMKGIPLHKGKWYYEAVLVTAGCLQIGWGDSSFSGHCQADRGDGCGDGPSSWAYDGWRRYRWHSTATEWGCRWQVGDVVGCLLDMDNKVMSFTLNGRGEEIGMGVAFSGDGFKPCGGVYACVSFNRREKIRLILGGEGNDSFHYDPPPGYRGVGEAVFPAIDERNQLLQEEEVLSSFESSRLSSDPKPYLCNFSDSEHGHELFAWQHRYYGSDASVHLGSGGRSSGSKSHGRMRRSIRSRGSNMASFDAGKACELSVDTRLSKIWNQKVGKEDESKDAVKDVSHAVEQMDNAFDEVISSISKEIEDNNFALAILYAKKAILHLAITMSSNFDINMLVNTTSMKEEMQASYKFWNVVENCCSLHAAGWGGEAGAMAIASEALGLGISSNESSLHSGSTHGIVGSFKCASNSKDVDDIVIPCGAITQFLSNVIIWDEAHASDFIDPSTTLVACAEAAIGGESGGLSIFLRKALQNAVASSESLRRIILASIRRSVRLLAAIEHTTDTSTNEDDYDEKQQEKVDDSSQNNLTPDARLVSFLTGLMLSEPVINKLESVHGVDTCTSLAKSLFEGWNIGLLSASMPWRMICAMTTAGILNKYPVCFGSVSNLKVVHTFFQKLCATVGRRLWAERAAVPICSKYVQAQIELLCSVKRALSSNSAENVEQSMLSFHEPVDASTPRPFQKEITPSTSTTPLACGTNCSASWEWEENWVGNDECWEIWTGSVECLGVDWVTPSRSAVRTLMDGGEGPPMLREGCAVLRGLDWDEPGSGSITGNEDGKNEYDSEKANREKEVEEMKSEAGSDKKPNNEDKGETTEEVENRDNSDDNLNEEKEEKPESPAGAEDEIEKKATPKKKKKLPSPQLPVGTVISIEPWNGIPGMGRRVRWNLTNEEGIYRYGGDGGRYDIVHIDVNEKKTRIRKRHPLPESAEQCASRYGFGAPHQYNVLLRLRRNGYEDKMDDGETDIVKEGILEWPDFGAGVLVECRFHEDGAVSLTEKQLLFGCKDSGWEARFGQPSFVPGMTFILSPTAVSSTSIDLEDGMPTECSQYGELVGSLTHFVEKLRNRADGSRLCITSEIRMVHCRQSHTNVSTPTKSIGSFGPTPPPIFFDKDLHASSMSLSRDGRTITCVTSEGKGTAYASVGFTKGVHYWEVKIEQADIGSVYIGVAEKPSSSSGSSSSQESQPRLNKWNGWGFVNFRATYHANSERVYGAHCHAGDTVGVLLDCDAGRLSFFVDGVKYGEHIMNDLGCAFENLSPFGFNADGCGSGGAGQGAPNAAEGGRGGRYPANGIVRPKALWPVVGLRHPGDKVTMTGKWMSSYGIDGITQLRNVLAVDEVLCAYEKADQCREGVTSSSEVVENGIEFPKWFIEESYEEYKRWYSNKWKRASTRGSSSQRLSVSVLNIDIDTSPFACACACASLGLDRVLLQGDRVVVKRSGGRLLELSEEAEILGAYQGRLWYQIVSQKSEGGSLTEGGGRAWFWDESEVVDNSIQLSEKCDGNGIELPLMDRFTFVAEGGLRIIYVGGAVVRSDLEIFDGSANIGTIPKGTVIPRADVLERRRNSCGVMRYRVKYDSIGTGWISGRIRGGKEEAIVEAVKSSEDQSSNDSPPSKSYTSPVQCAQIWFETYKEKFDILSESNDDSLFIQNIEEFEELIQDGIISGLSPNESDSFLATMAGSIADTSPCGDAIECSFAHILSSLQYAIDTNLQEGRDNKAKFTGNERHEANQAAASKLAELTVKPPDIRAILARIAILRAFNRRAGYALPWLPSRPPQEGSAVLGGMLGFGASVERAGKSMYSDRMKTWMQTSSIGTRMRTCRGIFFSSTKKLFLDAIVDATTTPTPLSHDEYELPREVRTVRVNRLRARRAMNSTETVSRKKYSVFSQLQHELRGWSGSALRRGHVAKGHGGQRRAFKVKLIGEGVNDYSGPYREVFTDAIREIAEEDTTGSGKLGILDPSPNKKSDIGEDRSLYVFHSGDITAESDDTVASNRRHVLISDEEMLIKSYYCSYITGRNEGSSEVEDAVLFLGKLCSTALRHGILVDLPLPLGLVWKHLCEEESDSHTDLNEVDILACRQLEEKKDDISSMKFLAQQQRMLNSFAEGISSILPLEIFSIFSSEDLRDVFCGGADIDIELLQRVVEYEGYTKDDPVILYFWEALREMTTSERKLFLQFVWARSRLPLKEVDFEAPFKIQKDYKAKIGSNDVALPSASTCFFSLSLPEYPDKETLKEKLLFAINNVTTMESDYVTNDAEVGEGWRGL